MPVNASYVNELSDIIRPRLHGTGRIWNRAEIRGPFRSSVYTRTTEPDEFETP